MKITTIPSQGDMTRAMRGAEDHMRPNLIPTAAVAESYLTPAQCDGLLEHMMHNESYRFGQCGATTREAERPLADVFDPIITAGLALNALYWDFVLDLNPGAWMQSYGPQDSYQLHTDGAPGQSRKLTAVALLTDEDSYTGGELVMRILPHDLSVTRKQGSICVFPSWVLHYVNPITSGGRHTINLGFWGPSFR